MAVPKKKTTPSRRNMRRSHDALKKQNIVENKTTGEFGLSHHITADGYYKGKQIIISRATNQDSQDIKSGN